MIFLAINTVLCELTASVLSPSTFQVVGWKSSPMSQKIITFEELKAHSTRNDLYLLLDGKVYDVSNFINEHPGGDEVLLAEAGKDATEAFEDVGHSDEARGFLPGMLVGEFEKNGVLKAKTLLRSNPTTQSTSAAAEQGSNLMYFIPLGLLVAYFAWRFTSS